MPTIGPVTDQYVDSIIKSAGVANPNPNKTQGTGMRELIKKLRDRLEQLSTAGYENSPDGIISGLVLSVSDGNVNISPGIWKAGEIFLINDSASFPLDAQDPSQSRYDVVYADNQGALGIVSGSLSDDPTEPAIPENSIKVGAVLINPDDYSVSQETYTGAGSGLTNNGGTIDLGGPITKNTIIDAAGNIFMILNQFQYPDSLGDSGIKLYSGNIKIDVGDANGQENEIGMNVDGTQIRFSNVETGESYLFIGNKDPDGNTLDHSIEIKDTVFSKGAVYSGDYSANFTDRSLVDKAYVDNVAGGGGGGGTTCTPLIPHTYAELSSMVAGSTLVPGQKYLITDYKTVYNQPVTNIIMQGNVEPLVITAISTNEFDSKVTSTDYPGDLIEYQFSGPNNGVTIAYSIDTATSMTGTYNDPYNDLDDSFILVLWNDTSVLSVESSDLPTDEFSRFVSDSNGNLTLYVLAKMVTNTLNIAVNGVVHTYLPGYDSITDWYNVSRSTGDRANMPTGDAAIAIGRANVVIQAFDNDNPQPSYTPIPDIVQSGWITKRTDPQHNEAPFDLRAVKFRRYKALQNLPSMANGPSLSMGSALFGEYPPSTSNDWDRGVFVAGKNITGLVHNNHDGSYIKILSYDLISQENVLAKDMGIGNSTLQIDTAVFGDYLCFTSDGDETNSEGRITSCRIADSSQELPNVVIRAFPQMKVTNVLVENDCAEASIYGYVLNVSDVAIGYNTTDLFVVDSSIIKLGMQSAAAIVSNVTNANLFGAANDAVSYGSNITLQRQSQGNVLSGIDLTIDTQSSNNYIFNSTGVKIGAQSFNNRVYGSLNVDLKWYVYYNDIFGGNGAVIGENSNNNKINNSSYTTIGDASSGNTVTLATDTRLGYGSNGNTVGAGCTSNVLELASGNTLGTNCVKNYIRNQASQNFGNDYNNHTPWA